VTASGKTKKLSRAKRISSLSDQTIAIVGAGSFATALASVLCTRDTTSAILYTRDPELLHDINRNKRNESRLPGVSLSRRIAATSDLEELASVSRVVILSVSSLAVPEVLRELGNVITPDHLIAHAIGALGEGDRRISQLITDRTRTTRVAAMAGPALPADLANRRASAIVVASEDDEVSAELKRALHVPAILRVYRNSDLLGVELAAALSTALTLAMGVADGLGIGHGPRTVLLTRAAGEGARLCLENGAHMRTFYGMAGLGNLLVRSSPESRADSADYQLGIAIARCQGQGQTEVSTEGVRSLAMACRLGELLGLRMPVMQAVHQIAIGEISVDVAADRLAASQSDLE